MGGFNAFNINNNERQSITQTSSIRESNTENIQINNFNGAYGHDSQANWNMSMNSRMECGGADRYLPNTMIINEAPQQCAQQSGPLGALGNPLAMLSGGGEGNPLSQLPNPMQMLGGIGGGGSDSNSGPNPQDAMKLAETAAPLVAAFI